MAQSCQPSLHEHYPPPFRPHRRGGATQAIGTVAQASHRLHSSSRAESLEQAFTAPMAELPARPRSRQRARGSHASVSGANRALRVAASSSIIERVRSTRSVDAGKKLPRCE